MSTRPQNLTGGLDDGSPAAPGGGRFDGAIISDLLLWAAILAIILGVWYYMVFIVLGEKQQVLRLRFRDANEISRGENVMMMGVNIGYVDNISLKKDIVEVVIKTDPRAPQIPSGSSITVMYKGLVGDKQIEITPPEIVRPMVNGKPQFVVEDPIRLSAVNDAQTEVALALKSGAENFADFFGKKKSVPELQENAREAEEITAAGVSALTRLNYLLVDAKDQFHQGLGGAIGTISGFSTHTAAAARFTDPDYMAPNMYSALRFSHNVLGDFRASMVAYRDSRGQEQFNRRLSGIQGQMNDVRASIIRFDLDDRLTKAENGLQGFANTMDRADRFFGRDYHSMILNLRRSIRNWGDRFDAWAQRLD